MEVQRIISVLQFISLIDFLLCLDITLHSFRQEDSVSNCTHGLIAGVDDVVFKSVVNYSTDPSVKFIYFQVMRKYDNKYTYFCFLDVEKNCAKVDSNASCQCSIYKQSQIVNMTIILKAALSYNGALLRGTVIRSDDDEIRSQEQLFPQVYDSTTILAQLEINNRKLKLPIIQCGEQIIGSELIVSFSCTSPLSPCVIEISTSDITDATHGQDKVEYYRKFNSPIDLNVTIRYAACRFDWKPEAVTCSIRKAQLDSLACASEVLQEQISINCTISKAYPKAQCIFFVNDQIVDSAFTQTNTSTENIMLPGSPTYYKTNCLLSIYKPSVQPGLYKVVAVMYQNINGDMRDRHFGENQTLLFEIAKIARMFCVSERSGYNTRVKCNATRIYPEANCRVSIRDNSIKRYIPDASIYVVNEIVHQESTYYISSCTYTLQKNTLTPGLYEVFVTMYPNVTGQENDIHMGINETVPIYLEENHYESSIQFDPNIIAYVVVAILLSILLLLTIRYFKCKDKCTEIHIYTSVQDSNNTPDDYMLRSTEYEYIEEIEEMINNVNMTEESFPLSYSPPPLPHRKNIIKIPHSLDSLPENIMDTMQNTESLLKEDDLHMNPFNNQFILAFENLDHEENQITSNPIIRTRSLTDTNCYDTLDCIDRIYPYESAFKKEKQCITRRKWNRRASENIRIVSSINTDINISKQTLYFLTNDYITPLDKALSTRSLNNLYNSVENMQNLSKSDDHIYLRTTTVSFFDDYITPLNLDNDTEQVDHSKKKTAPLPNLPFQDLISLKAWNIPNNEHHENSTQV